MGGREQGVLRSRQIIINYCANILKTIHYAPFHGERKVGLLMVQIDCYEDYGGLGGIAAVVCKINPCARAPTSQVNY